jgi:hypothetical protein
VIIALVIAVPGVALLLMAAFAGLAASQGRTSQESLVAPRNAEFGAATRGRAEATRAQARADLKTLTARSSEPALPTTTLAEPTGSDQPRAQQAA